MKTRRHTTKTRLGPTEDDVRDYAYHLYLQSGCVPGRDLENWLEAKACVNACIPKSKTHTRLHHHILKVSKPSEIITTSLESRNLSS